jgi:uncharacterized membrane protein YoaK (UPF0700 family)
MVLAFVAVFVDVVCCLGLFRTFTAFITGNIIVLSAELERYDSGTLTKLLVLPTFAIAAAGSIALIKRMRRGGAVVTHHLIAMEAALPTGFMPTGGWLSPLRGGNAWQTMLATLFAVLAISVQNAMMMLVLQFHMPTTVMTGNLTKIIAHLLEAASSISGPRDATPTNEPRWSNCCATSQSCRRFSLAPGAGHSGFHGSAFTASRSPLLAALGWRIAAA